MEKQGTIVMSRQQLYDEIWKMSVSGVAKKYNLNYGQLIATCKRENIPFPPSGYWTKLNLGKDVSGEVVKLPESEKTDIELLLNGIRVARIKKAKSVKGKENPKQESIAEKKEETQKFEIKQSENANLVTDEDTYNQTLLFLKEEERRKVIDKALSLEASAGGRLHPVLVQYKQSIETYNKQVKEAQKREYYNPHRHNPKTKPEFISDVSDGGMKRIIAILDVIFKAIEALGGHVDSDLSMKIKNDYVRVRFAEGQDK